MQQQPFRMSTAHLRLLRMQRKILQRVEPKDQGSYPRKNHITTTTQKPAKHDEAVSRAANNDDGGDSWLQGLNNYHDVGGRSCSGGNCRDEILLLRSKWKSTDHGVVICPIHLCFSPVACKNALDASLIIARGNPRHLCLLEKKIFPACLRPNRPAQTG